MLQATIAVINRIEHENIAFKRWLFFGFVDLPCQNIISASQIFCVSANNLAPSKVAVAPATTKRCFTPRTVKFATPKRTQFKRAIHQFVIIRKRITTKTLLVDTLSGVAPVATCQLRLLPTGFQGQDVWGVFLPFHAQAQTGAVEKPTRIVQPSGSHRIVMRKHLVADANGLVESQSICQEHLSA